jgi:hypothetical protein
MRLLKCHLWTSYIEACLAELSTASHHKITQSGEISIAQLPCSDKRSVQPEDYAFGFIVTPLP